MCIKIGCALLALTLALANVPSAYAQLRPEVTPPPTKPAAPKPTQIVVETTPEAQVYLDDVFKGQASEDGRLVIENAKPGEHNLRVSLPGKRDFQRRMIVVAGKQVKIVATLAEPPGTAAQKVVARVQGPSPGQARENAKDGLKYVWIPPGTFAMGCSPGAGECEGDEKPAHRVTITKGFWMGQTEVTVAAYRRFAGGTGAQMPAAPNFNAGWDIQNMPIVNVSWDEATTFCGWAGGRLATEAEWEYAARAGSIEPRYGPLSEVAWYSDNSGQKTHEVALKLPNSWNLYDTLGNVWEWVSDWYGENYYPASPERDPRGPDSGKYRVLRGGSWGGIPWIVFVAYRGKFNPAGRGDEFGFRCAREVDIP